MAFSAPKEEFALKGPRPWASERRLKFLLVVGSPPPSSSRSSIPPSACSATTPRAPMTSNRKRSRDVAAPPYRFGSAMSRRWLTHQPKLSPPTAIRDDSSSG
jgi:hypothetical protein